MFYSCYFEWKRLKSSITGTLDRFLADHVCPLCCLTNQLCFLCVFVSIRKTSLLRMGHTKISVCSFLYCIASSEYATMHVWFGHLQGRIWGIASLRHCSRTVTMKCSLWVSKHSYGFCPHHPHPLCFQLSIEEPLWSVSVAAVGFRSFQHQHTNPSPMHPEVCSAESSILSALPYTILFQMAGPGCLSKCHSAKFEHVHLFAHPEWD